MKTFLFFVLISAMVFGSYSQDKPIPRDTSYTPYSSWVNIRGAYPEAVIAGPNLPEEVTEFREVIYTTLPDTPYGDRDLHADVFVPKANGKFPAIIMVHGGGWVSGDKAMQIPLAQRLAAKGYVTIAVEYQLAGEAMFPAAVHNIKCAIRWARAHAEEYKIDPDQIVISGCSAGGQLAALVGLTSGIEKFEGNQGYGQYSSDVKAIIDIDGIVDFLAPASLWVNRKPLTYDSKWFGGSFFEVPEKWMEASPIFYLKEQSVPMLFINSGYPRFHAGRDELLGMTNRWGIYTEVHEFYMKVHPFWLFDPWVDPTMDYMHGFLKKVIPMKNDH
ncbi:alpha/beta hydrolase [Marinoscillum sp. MHG1-6]|uniref:alpha/beta hydrolase n=1 Tax=Marinoscillum sp. MHG1-6 TaxID=2959627 RepID=UPI0021574E78|nr:alpha/beta hydrolase [Marinoscillum sp. MHG1-6]